MDALAKLTAIEELKGLKARYCRAVDTKDAALLRTLFTDDAVLDVRGSATDPVSGVNFAPEATAEAISGLDAIVDMYMLTVKTFTSVHQASMAELVVTGDTTATGVWALTDILRFKDTTFARGMDGYGNYHETYECVNGDWKIKTMRLTRLLIDVHPA